MLTRHAITQRADADGVDAAVAERDYVLAHVIAQLHHAVPADGGRLVFKGGTALRFAHIPDYRYSADLDFTVTGGGDGPAIDAIGQSLTAAREYAGFPSLELTRSSKPVISYVGPLGAAKPRQIKLDVTADELVESVEQRTIQAMWSDMPSPVAFGVYVRAESTGEGNRSQLISGSFRRQDQAVQAALGQRDERAHSQPTTVRPRLPNRPSVPEKHNAYRLVVGQHGTG